MSLIITPELIDTYLSLTYPRTTHVSFTDSAELLRREFRLLKIRDLVKQPLTIEDFMRRPFNRRSRYLLLGVERQQLGGRGWGLRVANARTQCAAQRQTRKNL